MAHFAYETRHLTFRLPLTIDYDHNAGTRSYSASITYCTLTFPALDTHYNLCNGEVATPHITSTHTTPKSFSPLLASQAASKDFPPPIHGVACAPARDIDGFLPTHRDASATVDKITPAKDFNISVPIAKLTNDVHHLLTGFMAYPRYLKARDEAVTTT